MWTLVTAVYMIGLVGTVASFRRERTIGTGRVVETTCSVLWPVYWSVLYFCTYRNRKRDATD